MLLLRPKIQAARHQDNTAIIDKLLLSIYPGGHFKSVQSWNMLRFHSYDYSRRNRSGFQHCPSLWSNIRRSTIWLIWQRNTLIKKTSGTMSNILFYHLIRKIARNRFSKSCCTPWLDRVKDRLNSKNVTSCIFQINVYAISGQRAGNIWPIYMQYPVNVYTIPCH